MPLIIPPRFDLNWQKTFLIFRQKINLAMLLAVETMALEAMRGICKSALAC